MNLHLNVELHNIEGNAKAFSVQGDKRLKGKA